MRALIVEDDDLVYRALARLLQVNDWEVARSTCIAEACARVRDQDELELVLLDLALGAESGVAVLAELARRRPPVATVVVSGTATHDDASRISVMFGVPYVAKPASTVHLLATIAGEFRVVQRVRSCGLVGLAAIAARSRIRNLIRALWATRGNQCVAADMLGMPRTTLQDAVARFGITRADWEEPD